MDKIFRFRKNPIQNRQQKGIAIFSAFALLMAIAAAVGGLSSNLSSIPTAYAANTLTVNGYALDGRALSMWVVIQQNGATVKTGFTPLTFAGVTGMTYSVQAHDYAAGAVYFDHWENGSTTRSRSVALNSDVSVTSYYNAPPPPNRAPVAINDTAITDQNKPVTINVLSNDSDADGNSLTVVSATAPMHGSVVLNADNASLMYTPATKFSGQDGFSYLVSDSKGATATGSVTVQVSFVNSAPVAVDQSVTTDEDAALPINLGASDNDVGDSLIFSVTSNPLHGSLTPISGNASATYTPEANFNGQDSFQFVANDGFANSNTATVTVTVTAQNDAPVAASGSTMATTEDVAKTILLNATDVDGESLSYSIVQNPLHGTLAANGGTDGSSFTYTPAANYNGPDNFAFTASDGKVSSNTASVSIAVAPANDNPAANNDLATTNQDVQIALSLLANDSDIDGDTLKVLSTTAPSHGTTSISSDGLVVSYKPATGFSGSDSFSYTITDGNGGSSTATASITVKPPVASTYTLTVNSVDMYGKATGGLYTVITKSGTTAKTGFTPLSFVGNAGATYSVTVSDYGSTVFDHWDNAGTTRARTITLNSDTAITAVFRVPTVSLSPASGVGGTTSIVASGTYFAPSSTVAITYDGNNVATASTNSAGAFSASFKAPSLGAGFHTVQAVDAKGWKGAAKFEDTTPPPPHPLASMFPKTGVYVALYMYPSGDGVVEWQKLIDAKKAHPTVPIVATFNPNSGPGNAKDANFATWVAKEKSAGVIMIGYTFDDYGTRSLTALKADADKYKNWYGADGLFIDEFTNKVGNEQHYKDLTAYVKSIGMKMTMGNPGTDVPKSFVGSVDILNITEGKGYMPVSWLQYCVQCSADQGWHNQFDKRYFAYMRYDISSLDTAFETESAKYVGLLYITDGNDADGRWFHLPPYFSTEVATLDK